MEPAQANPPAGRGTGGPRVCHVTTVHDPFDTRIFRKECASLARAGYEVHLLACGVRDQTLQQVHLHGLPRPPSRLLRLLAWPWKALARLLELRPALAHLHDPELLIIAWPLRAAGIRVVFDVHENIAADLRHKPYLNPALARLAAGGYRLAEAVLASGLPTVHVLEEIARRYRPPTVVVRNLPWRAAAEVQRPPRAPGPLRLLYVGGISADRGAREMVQLLAELRHLGVDAELRLVGPIRQAGLADRLRRQVAEADVAARVLLTGPLPYDQALAEMSRADLGLCLFHPTPNNLHGLSTKLLEYMAAGLPVVASDFPAWREYVLDSGAGLAADPLQPAGLAQRLAELVAQPEALERLSRCGQQAIRDRYCWEREEPRLLDFYRRLLEGPP